MNPAPSTFAEHKAEAESVQAQRDRANASAMEAWQRVAELESENTALKRRLKALEERGLGKC